MSSFGFEFPYVLAVFPLLLLCLKLCPQKEDTLLFSNTRFLKQSRKKISLITVFKILTIFFLTITLASPYSIETYSKKNKISANIILAVDMSGSMQDSFQDVKKVLKEFLQKSDGVAFGLVYFGDSVGVASPLTTNKEFLQKSLESVKVGDLGDMDTTLYDALTVSKTLLENITTKKREIFVLSDGGDKGSVTTIDELLADLDKSIPINTIGFRDDFDKRVLQSISKRSGGKFVEANSTKELKKLFESIAQEQKNKTLNKTFMRKKPLYQLPLFLAFLSLLFYTYLLNKRAVV